MAVKLDINKSNPSSFAALAVAETVKNIVTIETHFSGQSTFLTAESGQVISGPLAVCRYLARKSNQLYEGNPLERSEIDHWLEFSVSQSADSLQEALVAMEKVLLLRSYLVGHMISLADYALYGMLRGNLSMLTQSSFPSVCRWYHVISSCDPVKAAEEKLTHFSVAKVQTEDVGKFMELPGAVEGDVVVRFPPEASGYLHIGHAKAALLNQHYQKHFRGKLVMRFDDTNPAKENKEFEKIILKDLELLQIKPDVFSRTSDHFATIMKWCEWMIRKKLAYADNTPSEVMKEQREKRVPSKCRNNSVEENLAIWEEMKKGSDVGQTYCIRAKIDMNSDNGCLRDPTMYRYRSELHVETNDKYKVYPTYDFACPIVDSIEGVTHALRTTEYNDRDIQYNWFLQAMELRKPFIWGYSRLNLQHTVLSKRKLTWFVDQGLVDGWDDPRFPTVRGVLRRGMTVEGLKQFIVAQGSSRTVVMMDWDKLWAFNRKVIDPIVPRYTAILKDEAVSLHLDGVEETSKMVNKHPKNFSIGEKRIHYGPNIWLEGQDVIGLTEGCTVTLINWGNAVITTINRGDDGKVTSMKGQLNLSDTNYSNTMKLTWLIKQPTTPTTLVHLDHLISKAILRPEDDFKNFVNHDSKQELLVFGDPCLKDLKRGDIIQLQRKGFYICDKPYQPASLYSSAKESPCVLFNVPDGHGKKPVSVANSGTVMKDQLNQDTITTVRDISDPDKLRKEIEIVGNEIRNMKAAKADKNQIDQKVAVLLNLKKKLATVTGEEEQPPAKKKKSSKSLNQANKKSEPVSDNVVPIVEGKKDSKQVKKVTGLAISAVKHSQLSDWYSQVITKGGMIEYYDVSGCYILRPWAYSIWEIIKGFFDKGIKEMGVENVYFPMFVSKNALEKEKTHIEDFAPEVAWVTKSGNSTLNEEIAIRPTSETVMYPAYAKWIQSHRDLPLKLNQWCNVVRWEFKHPQPFLRTREFLWQEGHTAYAYKEDAIKEVYEILELYAQVYEHLLAIPVIRGRKTEKEKFAGGDFTTTIEAFVSASGRGIQAATSHHLGQNFSKMFGIEIEDPNEEGKHQFVYQNSWGLTTRTIGIMVMIHGDDKGLVLPPRVASYQVVIVPCGVTSNNLGQLVEQCDKIAVMLRGHGIRVHVDDKDNYSPGWKFNEWELKGVPLRLEVGPRDIEKHQFVAVRRDSGAKTTMELANGASAVQSTLEDIQSNLYNRAKRDLDDHLLYTTNWKEFCAALDQKKLIVAPYCGKSSCEDRIKKESASEEVEAGAPSMGAKALCIPEDPSYARSVADGCKCIRPDCTNMAAFNTLFGRSY